MEFRHQSVLLAETIASLKIKPDGIYADGTLGGGGHSEAILERLGDPTVDVTTVTVDDIVENPYNLEIIPVLNTTIPTSLEDYDFGLITGSIVWNARDIVDPSSALAQEDVLPHLVLQVTVKEQDKDAEWAKAIVDAYHSDEFKAYLAEHNTGMWWIPEELR